MVDISSKAIQISEHQKTSFSINQICNNDLEIVQVISITCVLCFFLFVYTSVWSYNHNSVVNSFIFSLIRILTTTNNRYHNWLKLNAIKFDKEKMTLLCLPWSIWNKVSPHGSQPVFIGYYTFLSRICLWKTSCYTW